MPVRTPTEMPMFRSLGRASVASAVGARFSRAIARFRQTLLAAMHESRREKAQREIDNLRHLIAAEKAVTGPHASLRYGDQSTRGPARRAAEARRVPSHVA